MSKINDLIKKLCPNGVEYKSLKDVFELFSGMTGVSNKWADEGNCRFIDYMNAYKNNKIDITKLSYATVKNTKQTTLIQGDLLLTSASEVPAECAIASVIEDEIQDGIFMDDHLFGLRLKDEYKNIINTTFISYYLNSKPFRCNLFKAVRGVTRFYISNKDYMKLNIPIPPIEIQEEIVRILDKFGELEARKSQYEFWRGKLLENSKDKIKFGDIATIVRGGSPRPIQNFITTDDNGIPWIKIGDTNPNDKYVTTTKEKITMDGSKKSRFVKAGDFILSNSMSFGRPYILKIDGCIHDGWLSISNFENTYIPDFLYHLLSSKPIQDTMAMKASIGTVKNLNADIVKSIELPLYTKEEQEKIVRILDKFEELTNDISVGIPAEIELRRQQYEYYRNKLLSFEEIDNETIA